jgi:hypothetical protein
LRPDVIVFSKSTKTIVWAELTVPLEENISAAALRKTTRYTELAASCRGRGWIVHPFTIEVGAIGFVGASFRTFLVKIGLPKDQIRWLLKRVSRTALRSSFLIWSGRFDRNWSPPDLVPEPRQPNKNNNISLDEKSNRASALSFLSTLTFPVHEPSEVPRL